MKGPAMNWFLTSHIPLYSLYGSEFSKPSFKESPTPEPVSSNDDEDDLSYFSRLAEET